MAEPGDTPEEPRGRFLFDLADPDCYLVAERILAELPVVAEWEPVLARELGPEARRLGQTRPDPAALAERVAAAGLLALRLPPGWPPDSELAMRAAAFARTGGKTVAFVLAAFRQAFAAGRDLGDPDTVLLAAAAAELHPRAVLTGVKLGSVGRSLASAAERARREGVTRLPAIVHGGDVFQGPDALDDAVAALAPIAPGR